MQFSKNTKTALALVFALVAIWIVYSVFVSAPGKQGGKKVIGAIIFRQHFDAYDGLQTAIKELGYTEKDVEYDLVLIPSDPTFPEQVEAAMKRFMGNGTDVVFMSMEHQTQIGLDVTAEADSDLPIVFMTRFHDPVDFGIAESYQSSGNNATGVATNLVENVQRTLLFFKTINPDARTVGVFSEGFMVPDLGDKILEELNLQAPKFGLTVREYKTSAPPPEAEAAWREAADRIQPGEIDALFHIGGHFHPTQETDETGLAARLGIPHAVPSEDLPTGGNFSFSDDMAVSARQVAVMINKIWNGTRPSEIPVEFGSKNMLILHNVRAREAGFEFPDSMQALAEIKLEE